MMLGYNLQVNIQKLVCELPSYSIFNVIADMKLVFLAKVWTSTAI